VQKSCLVQAASSPSCIIQSFTLLPQALLSLYKLQAFRPRCTPYYSPLCHFSPFWIITDMLHRSRRLSALCVTFPCFTSPFHSPYSLANVPFASLCAAIDYLANITCFCNFQCPSPALSNFCLIHSRLPSSQLRWAILLCWCWAFTHIALLHPLALLIVSDLFLAFNLHIYSIAHVHSVA
jgi:hypothetical protein